MIVKGHSNPVAHADGSFGFGVQNSFELRKLFLVQKFTKSGCKTKEWYAP